MSIENIIAVLAVIASCVAVAVSLYIAHFSPFAKERREAYAKVIGTLAALINILSHWYGEEREEYDPSPETQEANRAEFQKATTQIERAVIEGDHILSKKSIDALSTLSKQLRRKPDGDWVTILCEKSKAAEDCIKTLRDESKSDCPMR